MLSKITAHNISATTSALSFSPSHQFAAVPCSQHRHILIYPNVLYVDDQFANRANHPIALTLPAIQRPRSRFYWTVPATDFKFALLENDRTIAKHGRSNCTADISGTSLRAHVNYHLQMSHYGNILRNSPRHSSGDYGTCTWSPPSDDRLDNNISLRIPVRMQFNVCSGKAAIMHNAAASTSHAQATRGRWQ